MDALVDKLRQGDRRSLARAMSLVDGAGPQAQALQDWLRQSTGQVPWWGFTGPPGVGKSTLIDAVLTRLRDRGRRIGVVAVDPTSPRSNGALLGDRVRMMRHAVDRDVFIRSLATHDRQGGLSDATVHCARLLEQAGYDPVLIETVGVGQNEVDIASVADLCVVMLGPGYGDDIQLIKAGLLEVADLVVVNKCDLPEANRLLSGVGAELGRVPCFPPTAPRPAGGSGVSMPKPGHADPDSEHGVACFHPTQSGVSMRAPGHAYPDSAGESTQPSTGQALPPEIVGIEAKSGHGVDELLDKLLELDTATRSLQQRQRHKQRRVLGEIRRSAMLHYEQALEHGLATPTGKELLDQLERGELPLESVVKKLIAES